MNDRQMRLSLIIGVQHGTYIASSKLLREFVQLLGLPFSRYHLLCWMCSLLVVSQSEILKVVNSSGN
uniref:Ovule protein n=1 Tax=Ascaris lumbricoides TaxID=6252 RepID=A0A0M3HJL9_ASCLU